MYVGTFQLMCNVCVCQVTEELPRSPPEAYFDGSTVECAVQFCPDQLRDGELSGARLLYSWSLAVCHTRVSASCDAQISGAFFPRRRPLE